MSKNKEKKIKEKKYPKVKIFYKRDHGILEDDGVPQFMVSKIQIGSVIIKEFRNLRISHRGELIKLVDISINTDSIESIEEVVGEKRKN